MTVSVPLPNVEDIDQKPYWQSTRERRLQVQTCSHCGVRRFPPRPSCGQCGSLDHEWTDVAPTATLYSWTVTHVAMHPYFASAVPYAIGVVELNEADGIRMLGRLLADPASLRTGMPMRAVFEPTADERVVLVNWQPDSHIG